MEKVEGAGLLEGIIQLLFGGLDKALSEAVDYQEEMGVLKQINRITIEDASGDQYVLTIKLSPVRDKQNLFYVEASTNAPNLDVSKLNGITLILDNSNINDFKKKIDNFLKNNKYSKQEAAESDDSAEPNEDENSSSNDDLQTEGDATALIEEAKAYYEQDQLLTSKAPIGLVYLRLEFKLKDKSNCILTITGEGSDESAGSVVVDSENFTINLNDDEGKIKDFNQFNGDIMQCIQDYLTNNGLSKNLRHGKLNASTLLKASFTKQAGKAKLKAVQAATQIESKSILAALDLFDDLAENEEFINRLEDNKDNVFLIEDQGDSFDVEPIDETISTENAYSEMFYTISNVLLFMEAYRWACGIDVWDDDETLGTIEELVSDLQFAFIEAMRNKYRVMYVPTTTCPNPMVALNEDGFIDIETATNYTFNLVQSLINQLELFRVNFDNEELQQEIDYFLDGINNLF